jgi:hypothetical protein
MKPSIVNIYHISLHMLLTYDQARCAEMSQVIASLLRKLAYTADSKIRTRFACASMEWTSKNLLWITWTNFLHNGWISMKFLPTLLGHKIVTCAKFGIKISTIDNFVGKKQCSDRCLVDLRRCYSEHNTQLRYIIAFCYIDVSHGMK